MNVKKNHTLQVMSNMALVGVILLSACTALHAQGHGKSMPVYDPSTVVTIQGSVEAVNQVMGHRGAAGTHLSLKTANETVDVHVGPSWFLTQSNVAFAKGDQIEVTGSKVKIEGKDALIAREIKKGDKTITLRNAQGIPTWSRGRNRNQ